MFDAQVGFLICAELWYFEQARLYGLEGVHLLVTPRLTGGSMLDKWLVGGRAAAIAAGAFGLSSNRFDKSVPMWSGLGGRAGWRTSRAHQCERALRIGANRPRSGEESEVHVSALCDLRLVPADAALTGCRSQSTFERLRGGRCGRGPASCGRCGGPLWSHDRRSPCRLPHLPGGGCLHADAQRRRTLVSLRPFSSSSRRFPRQTGTGKRLRGTSHARSPDVPRRKPQSLRDRSRCPPDRLGG